MIYDLTAEQDMILRPLLRAFCQHELEPRGADSRNRRLA